MSSVSSDLASGRDTPFRIGSALSRASRVYGAGFGKFFVLTLIPMAPFLIAGLIVWWVFGPEYVRRFAGGDVRFAVLGFLLSIFFWVFLSSLAQASCLYGAYQIMRSQSFGVADSLHVVTRRIVPVVLTSLLVGLAIVVAILLLIIPGIIVTCALYVALPACVIERLGAKNSLGRSWSLTRGHRWQIFGLVVLVAVVTEIATAGVGAAAGMMNNVALLNVAKFVVQVVVQSFGIVLTAVVYHDLRVAKEGVDIDTIASVFD